VRNLLVARVAGADSQLIAATADQRPRLKATVERFSEEDLTRYFQILLHTDDDLRRKPDARLHLEMGLLRMVNAQRLAPLEELLAELKGEATRAATPPRAASLPASPPTGPRAAAAAAGQAVGGEATIRASAAPTVSAERGTPQRLAPVPAAPPSVVAKVAAQFDGLAATQVDAIKTAILTQQKFLGELVEHASRWELEGGEMRLYFPPANKALADLLQSREQIERLRTISSQVMGQPLRVCVKLESAAATGAAPKMTLNAPELRAKFEQDPIVRAMLERFGGRISDLKRSEE
jgi:DNA polymerase-3 subunit gamma/tau